MITPEFQQFYYWEFTDTPSKAVISFDVPKSFRTEAIQCEMERENSTLLVKFGKEVPIIDGELFAKAEKCEVVHEGTKFVIQVAKCEEKEWPTLIRGENKMSKTIDPHSAFELVSYMTSAPSVKIQGLNLSQLLSFSIKSGFLPALLQGARAYIENPDKLNDAIHLLKIAADKYQNPTAIYQLGVVLFEDEKTREEGFLYLTHAFEIGFKEAAIFVGCALSPLSDTPFAKKNATVARKYFEIAADFGFPIAYYELAKLYLNGVGGDKNEKIAMQLYAKAKELNPAFPDLIVDKTQGSPNRGSSLKFAVTLGITVATFGAIVFSAYKFLSRK